MRRKSKRLIGVDLFKPTKKCISNIAILFVRSLLQIICMNEVALYYATENEKFL